MIMVGFTLIGMVVAFAAALVVGFCFLACFIYGFYHLFIKKDY